MHCGCQVRIPGKRCQEAKLMDWNFNTSEKITYCLLSALQTMLICLFKRFQNAMHYGKIDIRHLFAMVNSLRSLKNYSFCNVIKFYILRSPLPRISLLVSMLAGRMPRQVTFVVKFFTAFGARIRPLPGVYEYVSTQITRYREGFSAVWAREWLVSRVDAFMNFQGAFLAESHRALWAGKRFLACEIRLGIYGIVASWQFRFKFVYIEFLCFWMSIALTY